MIRLVTPEDAEAVLEIYRPYIEKTAITFECDVPSVEEFRRRIEEIAVSYPYLIWEEAGAVLGYAYAHRFRERAAYDWDAELSVYVSENYLHRGVGRRLYACLLELLTQQKIRNVYGCVTIPNERSENLHKAMGFQWTGAYHHSGYKMGRWYDVAWYEKDLGNEKAEPIRPFSQMDPAVVQEILDAYSHRQG